MGISSIFGNSSGTPGEAPISAPVMSGTLAGDTRKLTYCRMLTGADDFVTPSRGEKRRAWKLLEKQMALVPAGAVPVLPADPLVDQENRDEHRRPKLELIDVDSFYVDRLTVTNAEFSMFLKSGCYTDLNLWPNVVWPHIVQFVDETGSPGPRFWRNGRPAREQMDHPVTGISWYEASAYAKWVGKRLPTPAQWQRAGTWHTNVDGRYSIKMYPWGDLFDANRANVWASGVGTTAAVDGYYEGCTPNGISQVIGNVWEWVDASYAGSESPEFATGGLCEIRGGAFDTYFPKQATCQFRTGQPRLTRTNNTGFRLCIPSEDLQHKPG